MPLSGSFAFLSFLQWVTSLLGVSRGGCFTLFEGHLRLSFLQHGWPHFQRGVMQGRVFSLFGGHLRLSFLQSGWPHFQLGEMQGRVFRLFEGHLRFIFPAEWVA